jgi:hypothetical protein
MISKSISLENNWNLEFSAFQTINYIISENEQLSIYSNLFRSKLGF